jgi:hypothetical protein
MVEPSPGPGRVVGAEAPGAVAVGRRQGAGEERVALGHAHFRHPLSRVTGGAFDLAPLPVGGSGASVMNTS